MNKRSRGTNIFLQVVSIIMILFAILLGIGTKFVEFEFDLNEAMNSMSFWILFIISTLLTFTMFFSSSSISTSKEFEENEDYKLKVKNAKEVNTITALEHADDFLDEHYIDKKYEKTLRKLKNKLEKHKRKADRKGWNLYEPEKNIFKPRNWHRWRSPKKRFDKINYKYVTLKERIEDPNLKEEMKYTYVRGIYRVTRAYLSDSVNKYSMNRDPDKPVSGLSVNARKGSQRLMFSFIIVLFGSNIGYTLATQGYDATFWMDLGMKIVSYTITIVTGYMFGKTYFNDVFLDLEIKKENILQKYIKWLKREHPDTWNDSLIHRKELETQEMEMRVKLEREEEKRMELAKKIEKDIKDET